MVKKKIRFFPSQIHAITLALPCVALLVTIAYISFLGTGDFGYDAISANFILNVLTMNGLHLGFPLVLLSVLPAGREFIKNKISYYGRYKFFIFWGFTFFGLYGLSIVSLMEQNSISQKISSQILTWAFLVFPNIHGIRQSSGISLLFTRSCTENLTPSQMVRIAKVTSLERNLTAGICGCIILAWVANSFQNFNPEFSSGIGLVKQSAAALALLFGIMQTYFIWREPLFKNSGKALFTFRFWLSPFALYCQLTIWLLSAIHTQEYLALLSKISTTSEGAKVRVRLILGLILSIAILLPIFSIEFFFHIQGYGAALSKNNVLWNSILLALIPTITLLHYFVDGIIYRMRDPDVRSTLGSVLLPRHRT